MAGTRSDLRGLRVGQRRRRPKFRRFAALARAGRIGRHAVVDGRVALERSAAHRLHLLPGKFLLRFKAEPNWPAWHVPTGAFAWPATACVFDRMFGIFEETHGCGFGRFAPEGAADRGDWSAAAISIDRRTVQDRPGRASPRGEQGGMTGRPDERRRHAARQGAADPRFRLFAALPGQVRAWATLIDRAAVRGRLIN